MRKKYTGVKNQIKLKLKNCLVQKLWWCLSVYLHIIYIKTTLFEKVVAYI